jgi:hypothetical protein
MRGIARTSERCEQHPQFQRMMQRLGNTEAMCSRLYNQREQSSRKRAREETTIKQTLHQQTEPTASNVRVRPLRVRVFYFCSTFGLLVTAPR